MRLPNKSLAAIKVQLLQTRNAAITAIEVAAFNGFVLAGAEIRQGVQTCFTRVVFLDEPHLVSAEQLLTQQGGVVGGEQQLGLAIGVE